MCFGEAMVALSLCMEIAHRYAAMETSEVLSLLEFCSCRRLGGALGPSLLSGTLEGADLLRSQIRAKGSRWLRRKEKTVLRAVAGKVCSGPVAQCCWFLSLNLFTATLLRVDIPMQPPSQVGVLPENITGSKAVGSTSRKCQ